jgi:hypothetical protein
LRSRNYPKKGLAKQKKQLALFRQRRDGNLMSLFHPPNFKVSTKNGSYEKSYQFPWTFSAAAKKIKFPALVSELMIFKADSIFFA